MSTDLDSARSGAFRRSGRRAFVAARVAFIALSGCVLLFVGGFAVFAHHVSAMSAPPEPGKADAIVVLTGGQARIDAAVDLLKLGKGKRLLISGVNPIAGIDDLRLATGGDEALFECCVDIDHAALDTIGNAQESTKWMSANAFGSIILVTNNYHIPRSMLEMRRLASGAELKPYPVVNSPLGKGGWLTKPDALRVLFTEYVKYVAAVARALASPTTADPVQVVSAKSE